MARINAFVVRLGCEKHEPLIRLDKRKGWHLELFTNVYPVFFFDKAYQKPRESPD
ncbi:hypothetical protein BN341_8380 [Helicobacter heilmannii ASB1.4]|nr:hypothetical protein BN341_8380 [Helicobacter heilmannii ASB1.4]